MVGFIGPVLFYSLGYESHVAFGHSVLWLQIGLELGLLQGLMFALLGFVAGYSISKVKNIH